ncbi:MAG: serine hydrolase domain-containing protein, partial [Candidatus Promineifilaceae bacterium]|nr:serine hydrolase domain-containing protein [Candidatus Promineifilaceae bacterium]
MKKANHYKAVLFLVFLIIGGCVPKNQDESRPPEQTIEEEMETFLQAHEATGEFMGAVLVARGDEILKSGGYGMANLEHDVPNAPQTVFRLASLTKPFTAAAVLQLQEQGLLDVNETIDQYLPDYPHGSEITISQLLNHTSGIPDYEFLRPSAALRSPISLEELIDIFADLPLEFPPGSQWSYSNSGYVVLTAIIEIVSGQGYADYLAQEIFQPLGMDSTAYEDLDAILPNRAAGYTLGSDGYHNSEYFDISNATGAGGLVSTVNDMYMWDRALYGDEILGQASREAFFTPMPTISEGMDYTYAGVMIAMPDRKYIQFNGQINGFFTASMR